MQQEKIKDLIVFVRQKYSGSSTGIEDTIAYLKEQDITRVESFYILVLGLKITGVKAEQIVLDNRLGKFVDLSTDFEETWYYEELLKEEYGSMLDLLSPP